MNLISCDGCGVVLDAEKLAFEKDLYDETGLEIDHDKASWDGDRWVAKVGCPICGSEILKPR